MRQPSGTAGPTTTSRWVHGPRAEAGKAYREQAAEYALVVGWTATGQGCPAIRTTRCWPSPEPRIACPTPCPRSRRRRRSSRLGWSGLRRSWRRAAQRARSQRSSSMGASGEGPASARTLAGSRPRALTSHMPGHRSFVRHARHLITTAKDRSLLCVPSQAWPRCVACSIPSFGTHRLSGASVFTCSACLSVLLLHSLPLPAAQSAVLLD